MTSLSYELASELKKAGWPQDHWSPARFLYPDEWPSAPMMLWEKAQKDKLAYAPRLSELIDACGDRFWDMTRIHDSLWEASSTSSPQTHQSKGDTPEEATARLWLKLQESKTCRP